MLERQTEIAHAQAKVGRCHFCCQDAAELWFDPTEETEPYQVRCGVCGARGPHADCGWESAVLMWDWVGRKEGDRPRYRRPGSAESDHA